jgi:hypothetical protein
MQCGERLVYLFSRAERSVHEALMSASHKIRHSRGAEQTPEPSGRKVELLKSQFLYATSPRLRPFVTLPNSEHKARQAFHRGSRARFVHLQSGSTSQVRASCLVAPRAHHSQPASLITGFPAPALTFAHRHSLPRRASIRALHAAGLACPSRRQHLEQSG